MCSLIRYRSTKLLWTLFKKIALILAGCIGKNLRGTNIVIGTNAIYAYEAAAGIFFDSAIMATRDMDILWDIRSKLTLATDNKIEPGGLLGILRKSDRSFELSRSRPFQAVNRDGYMVDLIKAEPQKKIVIKERRRMGGLGDLEAVEISNLQWLLSSQKFLQFVIGDDGYPSTMISPDPRAFSLHKLWLSEQPDRDPIKKKRDKDQGLAVAQLVLQYLPQYPFKKAELKMFPIEIINKALAQISNTEGFFGSEP